MRDCRRGSRTRRRQPCRHRRRCPLQVPAEGVAAVGESTAKRGTRTATAGRTGPRTSVPTADWNVARYGLCASIGGVGTIIGTYLSLLLAFFVYLDRSRIRRLATRSGCPSSSSRSLSSASPYIRPVPAPDQQRRRGTGTGTGVPRRRGQSRPAGATCRDYLRGTRHTLGARWPRARSWHRICRPCGSPPSSAGEGMTLLGVEGHQGLLYYVMVGMVSIPALVLADTMEWDELVDIDWGTLLLFGGGISLADALANTGTTEWIANTVFGGLTGMPVVLIIAAVVLVVVS
ncbi:hypothetical protein C9J85_18080 [Haloferax sp. wsp5]|nr:hypothetical protein C9J85_18080 [Haloferax sp. wsp5]